MKRAVILFLLLASTARAGSVAPFTTIFMRTLLDDATSVAARTTLEITLTEFAPLRLAERSSDPSKPGEGKMFLWMSDGTEFGDDGDLIVAATAGGVTMRGILWDHSAASEWFDYLLLESGDRLLLETGDILLLE